MTERDKEELINDLVRHQDNLAMRIVILEAKVKDLEYVQGLLEKRIDPYECINRKVL